MLPVVAGVAATTRRIMAYSVVLAAVSLLLIPAADMGPLYAVAAVVLGAGFVVGSWRLHHRPSAAMQLFRFSNIYLTLLFAAVAVDVFTR
jgi:protoheme IX farnesyltransferase